MKNIENNVALLSGALQIPFYKISLIAVIN